MVLSINYIELEGLITGNEFKNLQTIFDQLITVLQNFLNLSPVYQNISLQLTDAEVHNHNNVLDLGVARQIKDNSLILKINTKYKDFLPLILLREVYYCFIPKKALKHNVIKICINQIVENTLLKISTIKEWRKQIRDSLISKDFLVGQLDKLKKFFKLEEIDSPQNFNVVAFFIKEIREGSLIEVAEHDPNNFYDFIFERHSYKIFKMMLNPDMVETIRVLFSIFHEKKAYLSLNDYNNLFQEFKVTKRLESNLSLNKFTENLRWINKYSSIAPSYDRDNYGLGFIPIWANLTFNPLLEQNNIKLMLAQLPFMGNLGFTENSFGTEVCLTIYVPKKNMKSFLNFLSRLEDSGYIIKRQLLEFGKKRSSLNLNYFLDESTLNKIIDPTRSKYEEKNEIIINKQDFSSFNPISPTFSALTLIRRSFNVSVTGLTFDKRSETRNAIINDIKTGVYAQLVLTNKFITHLNIIVNSDDTRIRILQIIEENKELGFFFLLNQLQLTIKYFKIIEKVLKKNSKKLNEYQLRNILKASSQNIESYLLIHNPKIKKIIFRDYLPLYFQSETKFKKEIFFVKSIYNLLKACDGLSIRSLVDIKNYIENPALTEEIIQERKTAQKAMTKPSEKINNAWVDTVIEKYISQDPPLISPMMLNTIFVSFFAKYYPRLIIEDTPQARKEIETLSRYFPKTFLYYCNQINTDKDYLMLMFYSINILEKELLLSSKFTFFKRFFWRGVRRKDRFEVVNFYNFVDRQFFIPRNYFEQLLIYCRQIFSDSLTWPKLKQPNNYRIQEKFFPSRQNINTLIKKVGRRVLNLRIDFNIEHLNSLLHFRSDLTTILLIKQKFIESKKEQFFIRYVKSINFIPSFQNFGFSQYSLYIRPMFYKSGDSDLDFKLLFLNSFQNIKHSACIESNQAMYIDYIFPYRTPNTSYLNWLTRSKKNIAEYCFFHKKKLYYNLHFDRNLTKEGWEYSAPRFKSYFQKLLFEPIYTPPLVQIQEFDLELITKLYSPHSQEYDSLTHLYGINSIDLKSFLGTRNLSIIEEITGLLKKKLIFPYINLQNLGFQEKVSIILPNIKKDDISKLIQIFQFFNLCHIYEIAGEYYIYGFDDSKKFENGLLIDLWFPSCEVDEFFNMFELLFRYFDIKKYLILTDLIEGTRLKKSVYGNISFLKTYNPLKNLIWNDKDKKWMNHKLFTQHFEKIYPDLIPKS